MLGKAEREAVAAVPGTYWVDLTDAICRTTICPAMVDHLIVYRDNNHLTATFAAHIAPRMNAALRGVGLLQQLERYDAEAVDAGSYPSGPTVALPGRTRGRNENQ